MPRHFDTSALHDLLLHLQGQTDRLNKELARERRSRIAKVRAASLPQSRRPPGQAAPDKQKTPEGRTSEVFTNRNSGLGSHGGCTAKSA